MYCEARAGIFLSVFIAAVVAASHVEPAHAQKHLQLEGEDFLFDQLRVNTEDFGYFLSASRWPSEPNGRTIIFVCWDNPSPLFDREMAWVRDAVTSSWQRHSKLEFRGWQACVDRNRGIRILIDDSGPHVKALGQGLDKRKSGMVLNFTFRNWSRSCTADEPKRELCIRSIAVHEFGHAIGFAHEHNRWDRPGECREAPQGTSGDVMLTPYDKNSVMNYCNLVYNNDGQLSKYDILAVQKIYGTGR